MQQDKSMRKKTSAGLLWSFFDLLANYGIQFIIQVMLARVLMPKDFGIIGMTAIFIAISNSFINSGFSQALIREKDVSREDYSTVFYFNVVIAIVSYFILYGSAGFISDYFKEPQLISITRILSLVLIINSVGLIHKTILIKNMDFKIQTKINIISSIVAGSVAIVAAYIGYGVWSLVVNTLVMQCIQSAMLCVCSRWRPVLVFKVRSFKKFFDFGSKLLISGLIENIYKNIYFVIIGRFFSASELGYYTNAAKLQDVASQIISSSIQRVSYPVLSSMQEDKESLKIEFRRIIRTAIFLNFPLMLGLASVATPLIYLIYGEKWMLSIPYFQLLCFAGMLFPLHAINLNILQVKGRSDLFLRLEIAKKFILSILIMIVLFFKLGIIGLIAALVLFSYISYFVNSYYSKVLISYSITEQLADIIPIFMISVFMAVVVYLSSSILPDDNQCIKLIFQCIIGCFVYVVTCKVAKRQELNTVYELVSPIFKKRTEDKILL